MSNIYADGSIVLSVDDYLLEYEVGSITGGSVVFFRYNNGRDVPIHVSHIDDICAQLQRMKHTINALEAEYEQEHKA